MYNNNYNNNNNNNYNSNYNYNNASYNQNPYQQHQPMQQRGVKKYLNYQSIGMGQSANASALISRVMGFLTVAFLFAAAGAFAGSYVFPASVGMGAYLVVALAGFAALIGLMFLAEVPGVNLVLLYAFTFIEGLSLSPLLQSYIRAGAWGQNILGQAFLMTTLLSAGLGLYAWTTKRDFTGLRDWLFAGLIILLICSFVGIFFQATIFQILISIGGIALFSGFMLYDVQSARYLANTTGNAVRLTVSIFLNVLNLFLFILRLLTIFARRS